MTAQVADWYRWPTAGRDQTFDFVDSVIASIDPSYYSARA
jgi:hypothetical protein